MSHAVLFLSGCRGSHHPLRRSIVALGCAPLLGVVALVLAPLVGTKVDL